MSLGNKIRALRQEANLTQADLGQKLNISAQAVSKWEKDLSEPDTTTIKEISNLFGISTDELLERTNGEFSSVENIPIIGYKSIQYKMRYLQYSIFTGILGAIFILLSIILNILKIIPLSFALVFSLIAAPISLFISYIMNSHYKVFVNAPDELITIFNNEIYFSQSERTIFIKDIATVKARHYY